MKPSGRTVLALVVLAGLGIFSRTPAGRLPWADKAFGDTLWAAMFYLLVILLLPEVHTVVAVAMAVGITFSIEFLKLYHAPWIDSLRGNAIGGMILGHAFFWHDFLSYILGIVLGVLLDRIFILRRSA
jgi:divalent metal cation (Fe/Co/Zn/Cd) transporter